MKILLVGRGWVYGPNKAAVAKASNSNPFEIRKKFERKHYLIPISTTGLYPRLNISGAFAIQRMNMHSVLSNTLSFHPSSISPPSKRGRTS